MYHIYPIPSFIVSNNSRTWKFRASRNTIACAIYASTQRCRSTLDYWLEMVLHTSLCPVLFFFTTSGYAVTAFRYHVRVWNLFETMIALHLDGKAFSSLLWNFLEWEVDENIGVKLKTYSFNTSQLCSNWSIEYRSHDVKKILFCISAFWTLCIGGAWWKTSTAQIWWESVHRGHEIWPHEYLVNYIGLAWL